MGVWQKSRCVAGERMFFPNEVSQCAEEAAGLGWSECHCLILWRLFVGVWGCVGDQKDRRVEIVVIAEVVEWRLCDVVMMGEKSLHKNKDMVYL